MRNETVEEELHLLEFNPKPYKNKAMRNKALPEDP